MPSVRDRLKDDGYSLSTTSMTEARPAKSEDSYAQRPATSDWSQNIRRVNSSGGLLIMSTTLRRYGCSEWSLLQEL